MNTKPNIIIVMTDDQGYGDLSCMGSPDFVTPNIDQLAAGGARFTSMYSASPVCSPSRAALMTGRYPGNAGVRAILEGHRRASGLTKDTPTIAAALKELGYSTALIGKWHLGLQEGCRPRDNGYDYFYGFLSGCIDYYSHIFYHGMSNTNNPTHDLWENDTEIYNDGKYFTDMVTEKAVDYIREKSVKNNSSREPFMMFVGYNAPHYPMHAPEKYKKRFAHLPWDRMIMAAMISAVDDGVGMIACELKRSGIWDDTIIYYQSDNGPSRESRNFLDGTPDPYYGGSAGILKGHKYSLFEGGIRVPGIISYPGVIPPQVTDEPVCAIDIFPTILNAAGGDISKYTLDGLDIMPMLTEKTPSPHDAYFWEMENQTAIRKGKYKLVINGQLVETEPVAEKIFLSDIESDMSESYNLADTMPELAQALKQEAEAWRWALEDNWNKKYAARYRGLT